MRIEKKNYSQVYLEDCRYKIKKTKMTNFIKAELESKSEPELKSELTVAYWLCSSQNVGSHFATLNKSKSWQSLC